MFGNPTQDRPPDWNILAMPWYVKVESCISKALSWVERIHSPLCGYSLVQSRGTTTCIFQEIESNWHWVIKCYDMCALSVVMCIQYMFVYKHAYINIGNRAQNIMWLFLTFYSELYRGIVAPYIKLHCVTEALQQLQQDGSIPLVKPGMLL